MNQPAISSRRAASSEPAEPDRLSLGERKQVTVVFADVANFAEITSRLEDEDLQALMNKLWAALDDILRHHGGWIPANAHQGDNGISVFGARQAREDDPVQAVRAALAMQEHLRHEPSLAELATRLRVGVHTGFIPLTAVEDKITLTGATVILACRLQENAPEGGVLISHDTYRHVSSMFDMRVMPPLRVKGRPDPLKTYVVLAPLPPPIRPPPTGTRVEMIGRQAEHEHLKAVLMRVIRDRKFHAVTIVGEAGIGKTCLFEEFQQWLFLLPQSVRWFYGRATQTVRPQPFALLRDVFFRRFAINESDLPEIARNKFERGFVDLLAAGASEDARAGEEWRREAHFIGQLLGLDYTASADLRSVLPDQAHSQALLYLRRFFAAAGRGVSSVDAVSQVEAALMVVEDAHHCDDASLDLIEDLSRTCADSPLMVVCVARPALAERRPDWGTALANHSRLNLEPLSVRESRALVESILQKATEIPPALLEFLVERGEGIPFFMVEIINMLVDQGGIVPGDERWHIAAGWQEMVRGVPTTLTGVLQARLGALEPADRAVAQMAAVVGRVFWDSAVEHLNAAAEGACVPGAVAAALDDLRAKQLILRCPTSAFADVVEYTFRHDLLRDVAYESVLKKARPGHHAQAAAWLIERGGARAGEFAATIAAHFERADRLAGAADWFGHAGEHARQSYAPAAAITAYRKALALQPAALSAQPASQANRLKWHEGLAEALGAQASYDEAFAHCAAFLALAEALADVVAQSRAWNLQAYLHERNGHNRDSIKAAEQAASLARGADEAGHSELLRALYFKGWACYRLGDAPAVLELAAQIRQLCAAAADRRSLAASFKLHGVAHLQLGRFLEASNNFEQGLELYRELGDRAGVAAMKSNLGESARLRGDCQQAAECYREALAISRDIGNRNGEIIYLNNLSGALLGLGQFATAESALREALALSGDPAATTMAETQIFLCEACREQGKLTAALDAAQSALALAKKSESHLDLGGAWRALGEITAKLADAGAHATDIGAEVCFANSLDIFRQMDAEGEQARTLESWGAWEMCHGRAGPEAGRNKLRAARDLYERLGIATGMARIDGLLQA